LSSFRDLHVALHSCVTIGSGYHEQTQVPQLWAKATYSPPATCLAPIARSILSILWQFLPQSDPLQSKNPSPETSSPPLLSNYLWIYTEYKESTNFSRSLKATVTRVVASVPPPYKIPVCLPEDPKSSSNVEEPSRSVMEVNRSSINDPKWIQLFHPPAAPIHVTVLTLPGADFYDMTQLHYQIDKGSF